MNTQSQPTRRTTWAFAGGLPQTLLPEADDLMTFVLPVQIERRRNNNTPEQNLLRAVLDDAVLCLKRALKAQSNAARMIAEECMVWLTDERTDYPTAFSSICLALDLEPAWIREGILEACARSLTEPQAGYLRRRCYTVNTKARDPDSAHGAAWKERRRA